MSVYKHRKIQIGEKSSQLRTDKVPKTEQKVLERKE